MIKHEKNPDYMAVNNSGLKYEACNFTNHKNQLKAQLNTSQAFIFTTGNGDKQTDNDRQRQLYEKRFRLWKSFFLFM